MERAVQKYTKTGNILSSANSKFIETVNKTYSITKENNDFWMQVFIEFSFIRKIENSFRHDFAFCKINMLATAISTLFSYISKNLTNEFLNLLKNFQKILKAKNRGKFEN